jgi:3-oxoacyl-[acyl-carrier protein] reductase
MMGRKSDHHRPGQTNETDVAMNDWFRDRVGLVTGAGSGMGYAIALGLGQAGAKVAVNFRRNRDGADRACQQIIEAGGQAVALQADVSRADQVQRLFEQVEAEFGGRLDMLVNNAGNWMEKQPIAECAEDQWDLMMNVNAKSVFLCCQQAARRMLKQGDGAIVNMGSVAGCTGGGGGTVPYAAAKAAVHTFTHGLARELAPKGIRVNGIAPGMIETSMLEGRVTDQAKQMLEKLTPVGRFGQADEIVPMVMTLLSPAASYISGQVIHVDGGLLMN